MIHELIDPKKKSLKSNGVKSGSGKTGSEHSAKSGFCDLPSAQLEQSDGESRGRPSASTTFIPPWLKSSLGLNQRNNQNLDWSVCLPNFTALGHAISDQRSTKMIPRSREEGNNDGPSLKSHPAADCSTRMDRTRHVDLPPQNISVDVGGGSGKPATFIWSASGKDSESACAKSELKMTKEVDSRPIHANDANSAAATESDRFKMGDQVGRSNETGDRTRPQKCIGGGERSPEWDFNRSDVDELFEAKAMEVLEDFSRKDVHSVTSEMKQLEAKLVLQRSKCRETKASALSQQELRLLQEIKHQAENKEEFDKFRCHIRDGNLKEWLDLSEDFLKTHGDRVKKGKAKMGDLADDRVPDAAPTADWNPKPHSDKESSKSTDEEGDIKRFSEFLSKNKNLDEKRKCLEEVRNYFDRKRRTRLTKRRWNDQSKLARGEDWNALGRDDLPRERPTGKDVTTVYLAREKKSRFVPCNEEVVEKAVSETLQKFMSLYHFHVSPTMMGNMRKNILQAIQSDPQEGNLTEKIAEERKIGKHLSGKSGDLESRKATHSVSQIVNVESLCPAETNDPKKNSFKTVMSNPRKQGLRATRENDILENNDNFRRLRKDFENCLRSVQFHADGSGLKIQSLVLEKEGTSQSKGIRFVYNFSKKSLECVQMDCEQGKSNDQGPQEGKRKDGEVQTLIRGGDAARKSTKCQTMETVGRTQCERSLQTEEKVCATNSVQTDTDGDRTANNVRELKDFDISPGLYRMVRSKDVGRFYLYPEREDAPRVAPLEPSEGSKSKTRCGESERKVMPAKKSASNLVSAKEMRVLYQDKCRGRTRRIRKRSDTLGKVSQERSKGESGDSKLDSSVSCLFFRKSRDEVTCENDLLAPAMQKVESLIETEDAEAAVGAESGGALEARVATEKQGTGAAEETPPEVDKGKKIEKAEEAGLLLREVNLDGCFWFWNGEMIKPGCDLKTHVENLLREKLKEINKKGSEPGVESGVNSREGMESAQVVGRRCSEKDVGLDPDSNDVFCFRKDDVTQLKLPPFIPELVACPRPPRTPDQPAKERCVRNVGTQNSQNAFLSLKKKSKTNASPKENGEKQKKKSASKGEGFGLKAVADLVKAVQEIRKFHMEADREKGSSFGSSSGTDATPSSSSTKRDVRSRSTSSVMNGRSVTEVEDKEPCVRAANERSVDVRQWTQKEERPSSFVDANSAGQPCRAPQPTDQKHWELIESVLNRVSLRERESLWNDIREFIKKKIGRDIDDEGAREVCIEIEQDVPKSARAGKRKNTVMARGHYVRNDGNVEVEIDLTLEDLEKILRQRHRKMHRRQVWNSVKGKKLFSSSSAQSGLVKNESRR